MPGTVTRFACQLRLIVLLFVTDPSVNRECLVGNQINSWLPLSPFIVLAQLSVIYLERNINVQSSSKRLISEGAFELQWFLSRLLIVFLTFWISGKFFAFGIEFPPGREKHSFWVKFTPKILFLGKIDAGVKLKTLIADYQLSRDSRLLRFYTRCHHTTLERVAKCGIVLVNTKLTDSIWPMLFVSLDQSFLTVSPLLAHCFRFCQCFLGLDKKLTYPLNALTKMKHAFCSKMFLKTRFWNPNFA